MTDFIILPIHEVVQDYKTNKHAVRDFAEQHGVTIQTVYARMRAAGVVLRKGGDINSGTQCRERNPNWKNGTTLRRDGYVLEYVDKKQHFQHRLVMERHLGRKLFKGEVVHHRNGNRADNRIENLELCSSNGQHHREHHNDHAQLSAAGKKGCAVRWAALKARAAPNTTANAAPDTEK